MNSESERRPIDDALREHGIDGIARGEGGWLDLRGALPSLGRAIPLEKRIYENVIFGVGAGDGAELGALNLGRSSFTRVRFAGCRFDHTNLRNCDFFDCDFRYARFTATSFYESRFANCDFYRAVFAEANLFSRTVLVHVSFDSAWLSGILGLDQSTFRHNTFWRDRHEDWLKRIDEKQKEGVESALESFRRELAAQDSPDPGTHRANGFADQESYLARLETLVGKERSGTPPTLVQEADELSYFYFLFASRKERPEQYRLDDGLNDAAIQASDTYRALAGMWSGQGQFDDSSFAYVRSKVWERRYLNPRRGARRRRYSEEASASRAVHTPKYGVAERASWVWLCVSGALAKFGEGLWRAAAWLLAITIVPGILYALVGAVKDVHNDTVVHSIWLGILFSLQQITTLQSDSLRPANRIVELFGTLQVLVGIGLLGLLAFVLGNRLRNA
jgi:hypothetical protein